MSSKSELQALSLDQMKEQYDAQKKKVQALAGDEKVALYLAEDKYLEEIEKELKEILRASKDMTLETGLNVFSKKITMGYDVAMFRVECGDNEIAQQYITEKVDKKKVDTDIASGILSADVRKAEVEDGSRISVSAKKSKSFTV